MPTLDQQFCVGNLAIILLSCRDMLTCVSVHMWGHIEFVEVSQSVIAICSRKERARKLVNISLFRTTTTAFVGMGQRRYAGKYVQYMYFVLYKIQKIQIAYVATQKESRKKRRITITFHNEFFFFISPYVRLTYFPCYLPRSSSRVHH